MRAPREFVKAVGDFRVCFIRHALLQGISGADANNLLQSVPDEIAKSFCFLDTLTDLWRYDFGCPPIRLNGGTQVIGTPHLPELRLLVSVMKLARQVLTIRRFAEYLGRLNQKNKHIDVLAEFQPLLHRDSLDGIQNEVGGADKKTIDWLVPDNGLPALLVEVKSRIRDLIESLESVEFARGLGVESIPAPRHDPAIMLRSAVDKFPLVTSATNALHCIWIAAHLKQEVNETRKAYDRLAAQKIHVVVFGGWTREASLIGKRPEDVQAVVTRLNLIPSERFIFRRS